MDFSKYNLTPTAKDALECAREKADFEKHLKVIDFHLLWAILQYDHKIIDFCFEYNGFLKEGFVKAMELVMVEYKEPKRKHKIYAPEIMQIIDNAKKVSKTSGGEFIGIDHILLALLRTRKEINQFLSALGVDMRLFTQSLYRFIRDGVDGVEPSPFNSPAVENQPTTTKTKPVAIDDCCENLNEKIKKRGTFEIFGREKENERSFEILLRKNKSNIILVGEAGVGKTAIVEGLVENILQNKCPDFLKNKIIYSLNLTSLLAGTIYRGQMEERIKKIIDKVSSDENCILFIDEIHNIVGAGSSEGSLDIANILKPALSRGDFSCIGATTHDEYLKFFKGDSALNRRFEKIDVAEPTKEQTLKLIKKAKTPYEKFHNVRFTPSVLSKIVDLCDSYLPKKKFPDKAFDILDEAGAKTRILNPKSKDNIKIDIHTIYCIFASKLNTEPENIKSGENLVLPGKIGF